MASELRGRAVLVAGLGLSGRAAARALARAGARVRAVETAEGDDERQRVAELRSEGVDAVCGVPLEEAALPDDVSLVVPSPGIPESSPLLVAARRRALTVWSEPELAWRLAGGRTRLVLVTGTNGKTTATELLGALLDAPTGGNIGTPLTELLVERQPPLAVAELSSFQLRFTETLRADVAVLLNVAPDHLDWHGTLKGYEEAKARAWRNSGPSDWLVLGDDDGARRVLRDHPTSARVLAVRPDDPGEDEVGVADGWITTAVAGRRAAVARIDGLALRGRHNIANACAAVAAAVAAGADPAALSAPLRAFSPGPHRLALVRERDGVRWVDDSKATNPHAAAAALEACGRDSEGVVWIAGGLAKGLSFEALEPGLRAHVRHAITIGAAGPEIARLARSLGVGVTEAGDLRRAVAAAADVAGPGQTVLLAPACASMDQFRDYAERGRLFAALARDLDRTGGGVVA